MFYPPVRRCSTPECTRRDLLRLKSSPKTVTVFTLSSGVCEGFAVQLYCSRQYYTPRCTNERCSHSLQIATQHTIPTTVFRPTPAHTTPQPLTTSKLAIMSMWRRGSPISSRLLPSSPGLPPPIAHRYTISHSRAFRWASRMRPSISFARSTSGTGLLYML